MLNPIGLKPWVALGLYIGTVYGLFDLFWCQILPLHICGGGGFTIFPVKILPKFKMFLIFL